MDGVLCDELLEEIFHRLPSSSYAAVSLVSRRFLRLSRSSLCRLSLRIPLSPPPSLSSFLSHFPLLSSLSLSPSVDPLVLSAASACPRLRTLRLLSGPVSVPALVCVSSRCPGLASLSISVSCGFRFEVLGLFGSLLEVSVNFTDKSSTRFGPGRGNPSLSLTQFDPSLENPDLSLTQLNWSRGKAILDSKDFNLSGESRNLSSTQFGSNHENPNLNPTQFSLSRENPNLSLTQFGSRINGPSFDAELKLEALTLSCIRKGDYALGWLYKSCKKLKRLQFRACEGIGDDLSNNSFISCIKNIQEVELRTCRMIIDVVLLKLAEHSKSLKTLLVYDGGCREGLLRFIEQSNCDLQKLDFRLPLDLDNRHLIAVAEKFRRLKSLRLQSCCLVTGEGLKAICLSIRDGLEELALINCDVAEKEPGLMTTLGQNLKGLKKLDLSHNETLVDKEFVSMIVSCGNLEELKLRGCRGLSNLALVSVSKCCKRLELVDIMYCCEIKAEDVELFVSSLQRLRQLSVEENKLSDKVKNWRLKLSH